MTFGPQKGPFCGFPKLNKEMIQRLKDVGRLLLRVILKINQFSILYIFSNYINISLLLFYFVVIEFNKIFIKKNSYYIE